MIGRKFMRQLGAAPMLLALTTLVAAQPRPQAEAAESNRQDRPNIIVFLVDDLGWQDTSVTMWVDESSGEEKRTPFNDLYRTPTLEKLAGQGVRFTQAYACAVCSPTRTSIMTGQNAARHHVTQWTLRPGKDPSGRTKRLHSPEDWRINGIQPEDFSPQSIQTLPTLLKDVGYRTIHVGKAHWGVIDSLGANPENLGFDVNIAGHHAGAPSSYHGEQAYGHYRDNQEIWSVPGLEKYHGLPVHLSDALTIEANAAVEDAVHNDQPFFLYMAHYAVHAPIMAHDPHTSKYLEQGTDVKESRYASMIEGMDESMKSLLKTVERLGQSKRTIIMFCSDNGGLSVHARGETPMGTGKNTHNLPLRAGKGSAYEGGTRIPQWVAWAEVDPAHPMQQKMPVASGAVRHEMTMVEDYYPTVLRWAGVDAPGWEAAAAHADENGNVDPMLVQDGMDFSELLRPRTGENGFDPARVMNPLKINGLWEKRPLLFHYPHVWGPNSPGWGYEPHSAMRLGDWKVIYFYQPKRWELYNLREDISELSDLARTQPKKLQQMAARMVSSLIERGAQWPTHRELKIPEPPIFVDADMHSPSTPEPRTPLVMVHGWGGDRHSFDALAPLLQNDRPVLVVDLPGHGKSLAPTGMEGNAAHSVSAYAEAIAAKMDEFELTAAILIGHSNGAPVSREFARLFPDRCSGIVSLDGSMVKLMGKDAADQFVGALTSTNSRDVLQGMMDGMLPADMGKTHRQNLVRATLQADLNVLIASARAVLHDQPWPEVQLEMPLLALHVEAPFWNDHYQQRVRALGPKVEIEIWSGLSHFLHFEEPQRIADRINQWIQKHQLDQ
jgi:arylsulfatase A-like enzyme/pimeloyl-ACP methyl ester carboxylesterase